MRRRQVAKGRPAAERRYEAAVRRQIAMVKASNEHQTLYWYADPDEMLRRGDDLSRFLDGKPLPPVVPIGAMPCGCRWRHQSGDGGFTAVYFMKRCVAHRPTSRELETWELDLLFPPRAEPVTASEWR